VIYVLKQVRFHLIYSCNSFRYSPIGWRSLEGINNMEIPHANLSIYGNLDRVPCLGFRLSNSGWILLAVTGKQFNNHSQLARYLPTPRFLTRYVTFYELCLSNIFMKTTHTIPQSRRTDLHTLGADLGYRWKIHCTGYSLGSTTTAYCTNLLTLYVFLLCVPILSPSICHSFIFVSYLFSGEISNVVYLLLSSVYALGILMYLKRHTTLF
jgi:hypothetical protein